MRKRPAVQELRVRFLDPALYRRASMCVAAELSTLARWRAMKVQRGTGRFSGLACLGGLSPSLQVNIVGTGYLGMAMAESLINFLAASDSIFVRPAASIAAHAGALVDPLSVARELNVGLTIEGSIQKQNEDLRVNLQVWDAASGAARFSKQYDSEMQGLFELQGRIQNPFPRLSP